MLIILATFTIPIIFTIRFGDGEKNVKETGGTVENIGNNELDEEKKENFAQNGASPLGENFNILVGVLVLGKLAFLPLLM